ncbi:hypothetical protein [Acetobacter cibinongensis]|uniref:Uncharacterized protein n=1 Tax=Acetobacter cibinongensis TaxID=146475 RepID=A0A1Z5YUE8_9PROT|nr:hypothetical protein [Acetobacter cibinongensis]OUJ02152.1 hypothetical protein HK14_06825 [Acetobacter cibinongensis]
MSDIAKEITWISNNFQTLRDEIKQLINSWEIYNYFHDHLGEIHAVFSEGDRLSHHALEVIMESLVKQAWMTLARIWDGKSKYNDNLRISYIYGILKSKNKRCYLLENFPTTEENMASGFISIDRIYKKYVGDDAPKKHVLENLISIRNQILAHRDLKDNVIIQHEKKEMEEFYCETIKFVKSIYKMFGLHFSSEEYVFWARNGAQAFVFRLLSSSHNKD